MLYVKMMSAEDCPDCDAWKDYKLFTVGDTDTFSFYKDWQDGESKPRHVLHIARADGTINSEMLSGNVYIMNEAGKTIASHGC
jgi:hypothetical protein